MITRIKGAEWNFNVTWKYKSNGTVLNLTTLGYVKAICTIKDVDALGTAVNIAQKIDVSLTDPTNGTHQFVFVTTTTDDISPNNYKLDFVLLKAGDTSPLYTDMIEIIVNERITENFT